MKDEQKVEPKAKGRPKKPKAAAKNKAVAGDGSGAEEKEGEKTGGGDEPEVEKSEKTADAPAAKSRARRARQTNEVSGGCDVAPKKRAKKQTPKDSPQPEAPEAAETPEVPEPPKKRLPKRSAQKEADPSVGEGSEPAERKKRVRVKGEEPKTFARRVQPTSSFGKAKWTALKEFFGKIIKPHVQFTSGHEDLLSGWVGSGWGQAFSCDSKACHPFQIDWTKSVAFSGCEFYCNP